MGTNTSNDKIISSDGQRITAIHKYIPDPATPIPVEGAFVTPAAIAAVFQNNLDVRTEVLETKAAYKAALAKRAGSDTQRRAYDVALKGWVLQRFGAKSSEVLEFGYTAKKVAVKPAVVVANAVALNQATRLARGTKGPKAKLKIKGTLTAPTAPAAPAPTAPTPTAPAPSVSASPAEKPVAPNGASNGVSHA